MFTGNTKIIEGKTDARSGRKYTRKLYEHKCDGCGLLHFLTIQHHVMTVIRKGHNHYCSGSCRSSHMTKEKCPTWKGGRCLDPYGYVHIRLPSPLDKGSGKYVREHRFIMEQKLGRKLLPTETVHHKNGIKSDNRIENLELWESAHIKGQRKSDLYCELDMLRNENKVLKNRVTELEALLNRKPKLKSIKNALKEEWGVWDPVPSHVQSEHCIDSGRN